MENYVGSHNPFRPQIPGLFTAWMHHSQIDGHQELAKNLYETLQLCYKRSAIWELTNEACESWDK